MAVKRYQSSYTGPEIDEAVGRALSPDDTPVSAHTDKLITSGAVADGLDQKAPKAHAASGTTYGVGNASLYGHVRLSDSADSSKGASNGYAATPKAVDSAVASIEADIPDPATALPLADGTAAVGTSAKYAREDHVHPETAAPAVGGENILRNWYLCLKGGFPINHRYGIDNPLTQDGWIFDRWYASLAAGVIASSTSYGLCIKGPGSPDSGILFQGVPNGRLIYNGQDLTCSILLDVESSGAHTTKLLSITCHVDMDPHPGQYLSPGMTTYVDNYSIGLWCASSNDFDFHIKSYNTSASVKVVAAKLEVGQNQTLAVNTGTEANPVWVLADALPDLEVEALRCLVSKYNWNTSSQADYYYSNRSAISSLAVADVENNAKAERLHTVGDYFLHGGMMYRTDVQIDVDDDITPGSNCTEYPIEYSMRRFIRLFVNSTTSANATTEFTARSNVGYLICASVMRGSSDYKFWMSYLYYNGGSSHLVDVNTKPSGIDDNFTIHAPSTLGGSSHTVTFTAIPTADTVTRVHIYIITLE